MNKFTVPIVIYRGCDTPLNVFVGIFGDFKNHLYCNESYYPTDLLPNRKLRTENQHQSPSEIFLDFKEIQKQRHSSFFLRFSFEVSHESQDVKLSVIFGFLV